MMNSMWKATPPMKAKDALAGKKGRSQRPGLDVDGWKAVLDITQGRYSELTRKQGSYFLASLQESAQPDSIHAQLDDDRLRVVFQFGVFDEKKWIEKKVDIWCAKRSLEACILASEAMLQNPESYQWDESIDYRSMRIGDVFLVLVVWPKGCNVARIQLPSDERISHGQGPEEENSD